MVTRRNPALGQTAFNLWTGTVNQHQAHAQAVQQHQVVDDIAEIGVRNAVAGQHDDEGAIAVSIDVRRRMAKPVDVFGHDNKSL